MDNISKANVQEMDSEAGQAMDGGASGCGKVFQDFAANLETLNKAIIYSGMTIWLSPVVDCQGTGDLELESIHKSILAGLRGNLKRLTIRLDYPKVCWNNARDCPNFLMLRLLLRDFIEDLEELTLEIQNIVEPFIQQYLPHGPYPKLKVLKLIDLNCSTKEETFGNQIRMLLSRAPNLKEIHTDGCVSLREKLMEGMVGVVHVHESRILNPMQEISESVIPALRLKWIRLFYNTEPNLELDRFNEKAQSLLRTCCATTLNTLELDAVSAVLFMSYGIQLVNLQELLIDFDYVESEVLEPRIITILSRIDFTHLFPNLKKVDVCMPMLKLGEISGATMDAIIEQASAVKPDPMLPRAGNIKKFGLNHGGLTIPTIALQFFADMFPAIDELKLKGRVQEISVGSAWELWPSLRLIKIAGKEYQRPSP